MKKEVSKQMRLLPTIKDNAFAQMAIDESLLNNFKIPILRFYQWDPPAVSIGRFQIAKDEVDIGYLEEQKNAGNPIDLVRRKTGGGAVFHDKEVTYTVIMPIEKNNQDIIESYKNICGIIIEALKTIEIKAEFSPINDIIVEGKKISGNAQTRHKDILLQHGTILLDIDVRMFRCLKIPIQKIQPQKRLTCLDEYGDFTFEIVKDSIIRSFGKHFKIEDGKFTKKELSDAKMLEKKYREWTDSGNAKCSR